MYSPQISSATFPLDSTQYPFDHKCWLRYCFFSFGNFESILREFFPFRNCTALDTTPTDPEESHSAVESTGPGQERVPNCPGYIMGNVSETLPVSILGFGDTLVSTVGQHEDLIRDDIGHQKQEDRQLEQMKLLHWLPAFSWFLKLPF